MMRLCRGKIGWLDTNIGGIHLPSNTPPLRPTHPSADSCEPAATAAMDAGAHEYFYAGASELADTLDSAYDHRCLL